MGFTGFNSFVVKASIKSVDNSYAGIIRSIKDDMQNQFVSAMADVWACREAQQFFRSKFKPEIDRLIKSIDSTFEDIMNRMNNAGVQWAIKTGDTSTFTKVPFQHRISEINVDSIRENINGERGIDVASSRNILQRLNSIKARATAELNGAKNAVNNSGFIGGQQQSDLNGMLSNVKQKIEQSFDTIFSHVRMEIEKTTDSYGDIANKISSTFSAGADFMNAAGNAVSDMFSDMFGDSSSDTRTVSGS